MAKTVKKQGFSLQGFDVQHYKATESYVQAIDALYNQAVDDFSKLANNLSTNPDKLFSFKDFPGARAKAQQIIDKLASQMQSVIVKGSRNQWLYACQKNDEFLNTILNTAKISKKILKKYQDRNLEALDAFQTRKVNGLGLSQRIWNYTDQMKTQMELGIDIALGDGRSAQKLSKDLRQYLVDPDKLFHKVKNKHGHLVLSKNAKAFHPGQGKYRSSYKNAMRLTRSEINMAYRESDQLRWNNLDFVIGYEIRLSNNHTTLINGVPTPFKDICDELAGKYPKTFNFKGWHPQCRCHRVPILQDREEFNNDMLDELKAAWNGTEYNKLASKNTVTDVPQAFKDYTAEIEERSKNWKSQPYWIKDNFEGGSISGGLKIKPISGNSQIVKPLMVQPTPTAVVKKPTFQFTEVKTAADVIRVTTEADQNNTWFARGFKDLSVTYRSGVNGFTDMYGRISLTKERYDRTISGINKIKNGLDILKEEADALATFWHEITHNSNKVGNVQMSTLKRRFMELSNEFVSRKTLPEFYSALGAKETPFPELMISRPSTGYNTMVVNYDNAIDLFGLNKDSVLASVRSHLINDNYNDQLDGLVDALRSNGIKNADGKKLTVTEAKEIIKCCDWYDEQAFPDALRRKGYIK